MARFERICTPDCTVGDAVDCPPLQGTAGRQRLNWLWLIALFATLPTACVTAACRPVVTAQYPPPAYEICPLPGLPAVFAEPELAVLFADLAPGQSLEVTQAFLRVAAPWPYLDIRGPGASGGGGMPNEPRAVFLLRASHPAVSGPLLLVAPARLQHQLRAAVGGGLPRDSWRVVDGPFAPTLYGRLKSGRGPVDIVAFPTTDPAASGPVSAEQRAARIVQIVDFFVSE